MIISDNLKLYVQKLRSSNLRPTKQRLKICEFLFDRKKTFHFTVETLNKKINKNGATKFLWQQFIIQSKHLLALDT